MRILILLGIAMMVSSCASEPDYFRKGGEVVGLSQAELLKNVALAMGSGGPGHAVDFCSIHALSIKDSLSVIHNCEIRRISLKYRNPEDEARTGTEKKLLQNYQEAFLSGDSLKPEVFDFDDRAEYYHPIMINNAACLLCHGTPGEQINEQTQEMIGQHYPGDLATGYKMGELRGAWKITFLK